MTTLDPAVPHVVVINTFEVKPENADRLVAALAAATEAVISTLPGFISANFHIGADRTKVANYAQWRSAEDLQAMLANPAARAELREAADLAEGMTPVMYRLVSTHGA